MHTVPPLSPAGLDFPATSAFDFREDKGTALLQTASSALFVFGGQLFPPPEVPA